MKLFKKFSIFLRDYKFSRIYLVLVMLLANIYLIATSLLYPGNLIVSSIISASLLIFIFANTRKKLKAQQLDIGVMIKPFSGMLVMQLLEGPGTQVRKSPEVPYVAVSLLSWLYFCVLAISSSDDEQYHYHEHLVNVVNEQYPELLPWIPEMYKELNATPPVPKQISMEDFNES
tara:strand:- start:127 stop:648 length:522 start_codon:yes stop_codon:yes gene_type:complete